jgi:hypothetical protein
MGPDRRLPGPEIVRDTQPGIPEGEPAAGTKPRRHNDCYADRDSPLFVDEVRGLPPIEHRLRIPTMLRTG